MRDGISVLVLSLLTAAQAHVVSLRPRAASLHMMAGTTTDDEVTALCRALQAGDSPVGLEACISTRSTANKFFKSYFSGDEWSCADAETPPAVLVHNLENAPESVLEVVLMNVVQLAAKGSDRAASRAVVLVNALWDRTPVMSQSCRGLQCVSQI